VIAWKIAWKFKVHVVWRIEDSEVGALTAVINVICIFAVAYSAWSLCHHGGAEWAYWTGFFAHAFGKQVAQDETNDV
jgi:hypothetical protein